MADGTPTYNEEYNVTAQPYEGGVADIPISDAPQIPYQTPPQWSPAQAALSAIPVHPELQAMAVHHNRIAQSITNAASEILSGGQGQQLNVIRNPDGSYGVAAQPMTQGQRWARVAAAALSGAAQGFAVGQGPGGAGRAAGAGLQAGLQIGQGNQDQTLALADRMNKQDRDRQLFNANMTMLDQKIIAAKNENQRSGVLFSNQVRDSNLAFTKTMRDMGATRIGEFTDDAGMAAAVSDPTNVQAHVGSNGILFPNTTYNSNGSVKGIEGWILPEDKRNQLNTTAVDIPRQKLDPDHPGKIIDDTPLHVPEYTMTGEQLVAAMKSQSDQHNQITAQAWTAGTAARKADIEAQALPSKIQEQQAAAAASYAHAALARSQIAPNPIDLITQAAGGAGGAAAGATPQAQFAALGSSAPRTNPDGSPAPSEAGTKLLAQMDPSTAALVREFGEYRGNFADLGRSKNREEFMRLVSMVYPQWDRAQYNTRQKAMTSIAPGGALYNTRSALNTAIMHMGTMADAMATLKPGEFAPANYFEQQGRRIGFGSEAAKNAQGNYNVAASGVATELNKAFANTGQTHQTETDEWRKAISITQPASTQRGTIQGALKMLTGRMSVAQQLYADSMAAPNARFDMLTPQSIATLHRLPGGDAVLKEYGYQIPETPQPGSNIGAAARAPGATPIPSPAPNVGAAATAPGAAATAAPPISKLSPSGDTHFANGQTWRLVNGVPRQVINGQVQ